MTTQERLNREPHHLLGRAAPSEQVKLKRRGSMPRSMNVGLSAGLTFPPNDRRSTDDTTPKYDFDFNYGWNAKADEPETPIWDDSSF